MFLWLENRSIKALLIWAAAWLDLPDYRQFDDTDCGDDVPFQLWDHSSKLKMTKEEVRQENKESEGSPKSRRKSAGCSAKWHVVA